MPVLVLDVPVQSWNEVVIQAVCFGVDMTPEDHRENGNTIVELTSTWEKLDQVFTRISQRVKVDVLDRVERKLIE
jgi:hypothetical protein